jgi:hypothetical protein
MQLPIGAVHHGRPRFGTGNRTRTKRVMRTRMALEQTMTGSRRTAGEEKCRRACGPVLPPTPVLARCSFPPVY